jgi:hypothetical protein
MINERMKQLSGIKEVSKDAFYSFDADTRFAVNNAEAGLKSALKGIEALIGELGIISKSKEIKELQAMLKRLKAEQKKLDKTLESIVE